MSILNWIITWQLELIPPSWFFSYVVVIKEYYTYAGSPSITTMKKVVEQLWLEPGLNRHPQMWNNSVCRMLHMTSCWLEFQERILSDPRKSVPFHSKMTTLDDFLNYFSWTSELNLKPVQKLIRITCAVLSTLLPLSVLNIWLSELSYMSISQG